jgi:hypothetical protein
MLIFFVSLLVPARGAVPITERWEVIRTIRVIRVRGFL